MQSREQWLRQRKELVTASDAYKILFGSALSVYEKKVYGYELEDCDLFKMGRDMETPIANLYAKKRECIVQDLGATEIQIHPDFHWLGATLDRWQTITEDGERWEGPTEIKTAGGRKGAEWTDDAPIENRIQNQIQMACTSSKKGTLVGWIWGNQMTWIDEDYRPDFFESAIYNLHEFYLRVKRRDPPPATSALCLPSLKRMYDESGETVALDASVNVSVGLMEIEKKKKSAAEKKVKKYEAEIRAALGHASWGALPDGRFVTLLTTNRDGHTVAPTSYRTLRIKKSR